MAGFMDKTDPYVELQVPAQSLSVTHCQIPCLAAPICSKAAHLRQISSVQLLHTFSACHRFASLCVLFPDLLPTLTSSWAQTHTHSLSLSLTHTNKLSLTYTDAHIRTHTRTHALQLGDTTKKTKALDDAGGTAGAVDCPVTTVLTSSMHTFPVYCPRRARCYGKRGRSGSGAEGCEVES